MLSEYALDFSQYMFDVCVAVSFNPGNLLKVFVKAVHPSNGRFRLTLDPQVTKEKVRRMRNEGTRASSRFSKRKEAEDLATGEEILGDIIKASAASCHVPSVGGGGRVLLCCVVVRASYE